MLYLQVAFLPRLFAFCACLPCLPARQPPWRRPALPRDPPTASHASAKNTLLAQAIKQELVSQCDCCCMWQLVTQHETGDKQRKLWRKCEEKEKNRMLSSSSFCCASAQFPKLFKSCHFSLHHLSHTDVRMSMTQQGHCFVVLFYLFLDNEKSAEGLAWGWLSHIFTHETRPRPYGPSTGGYLTLMTLWHQKHRSWSLFFRGLSWIHTTMLRGRKRITFFFCSDSAG